MKQLSTAALLIAAMFAATEVVAQTSYQLFGPGDTRSSTNTSLTPFGTTTIQLSCPASPTAIVSSSPTPTSTSPSVTYANLFADNFIGLSVNGNTQVDICQGGYSGDATEGGTDCFNTQYAGNYQGLTGDDPDTFVAQYGVSAPNIGSNLTPGPSGTVQAQFQLMDSGVSLGNSSIYLITNCTQSGIAPGGSQLGNPIPALSPSTSQLAQNFPFDSATGQRVQFQSSYTAAVGANTLTIVDNTIPTVTNNGIEPAVWPAYVAGTSFATTKCIPETGELDPSGNPLCTTSTILCTNSGPNGSTPMGDNCPQSTAKNVQMFHTFDAAPTAVAFPPGTGIGFLMGSDSWSPSNCTFVGPETGFMCPQNPITSFLGDFRSGSGGSTTNSTFIAVTGVPLPFTVPIFLPNIFGWSNSGTVSLKFTTFPPTVPPANNNGFIAAPIASLTYGIDSGAPYPDTSLPIPGDVTLTSATPCPSVPTAGSALPLSESATVNLAEGKHTLHWFATDCAGTEELVFTNNPGNLGNWATFKTLTMNVDLTKPQVATGPTLSPAGPYVLNQGGVKASYSCVDPASAGVTPSGVVLCGPTPLSLVLPTPSTGTLSSAINTSTIGPHTFTVNVLDLAGNGGSSESVTYNVNYNFTGFLTPVSDTAWNAVQAGSTVPLKFNLGGNAGLRILAAGSPTLTPVACPGGSLPSGAPVVTSGSLSYSSGVYTYTWKTNSAWKNTCGQVALQLSDGTTHAANFQFK